MDTQNFVGGAWLVAHYHIELVMPLAVHARIGGRRATQVPDGIAVTPVCEGRPG